MSTWTNKDGLQVHFGTTRAQTMPGGLNAENVHKTLVHKFTYEDVANTDTAAPDADEAFIPAGSVITRAALYVTDAFVGATAVLDIGLKVAAGTNTADDGILSTGIATIDADGDVVIGDGAYVLQETGDLTGIRLAADQYIMTTYDTAAFTEGAATLVVEYLEIEDL
jgi:hypothetical protein